MRLFLTSAMIGFGVALVIEFVPFVALGGDPIDGGVGALLIAAVAAWVVIGLHDRAEGGRRSLRGTPPRHR